MQTVERFQSIIAFGEKYVPTVWTRIVRERERRAEQEREAVHQVERTSENYIRLSTLDTKLRQEHIELQAQFKRLGDERDVAVSERSVLKKHVLQLKDQVRRTRKKNFSRKKDVDKAYRTMKQLCCLVEKRDTELVDLHSVLHDQEQETAQLRMDVAEFKEELHIATVTNCDLEKLMVQSSGRVRMLEEVIKKTNELGRMSKAQWDKEKRDAQDHEDSIAHREELVQAREKAAETREMETMSCIADLKTQVTRQEDAFARLEDDAKVREGVFHQMKDELASRERTIDDREGLVAWREHELQKSLVENEDGNAMLRNAADKREAVLRRLETDVLARDQAVDERERQLLLREDRAEAEENNLRLQALELEEKFAAVQICSPQPKQANETSLLGPHQDEDQEVSREELEEHRAAQRLMTEQLEKERAEFGELQAKHSALCAEHDDTIQELVNTKVELANSRQSATEVRSSTRGQSIWSTRR